MKTSASRLLLAVLCLALLGCATPAAPTAPPTATERAVAPTAPGETATVPPVAAGPTSTPGREVTAQAAGETPTAPAPATATRPVPSPTPGDPQGLISQDSLFATLEDLTAIEAYSGWRNSGSEGEAQALDYVAGRLAALPYLESLGLEVERQEFHVFLATELRETALHFVAGGREVEVPADGLRGPRDDAKLALRFDSDGRFNDAEPNPVVAEGPAVVVREADAIDSLGDLAGRIVFVDYALVDRSVMAVNTAVDRLSRVAARGPAGLVLVTSFSNERGESHGAFVGDLSAAGWLNTGPTLPSLYVRLEDMAAAGLGWDDLPGVEAARLTWDADVYAPGTSGNLVARIPGRDPSRAVILGAHIDSANSPGAMDDGSGSAVLVEVARALDGAGAQPPIDLILAWFGSEELSLYGGGHFAATHQELLDRTVGMLQVDCLSRPLDGVDAWLKLVTWPYGRQGDDRLLWAEHLAGVAEAVGVDARPEAAYFVYSDNSTLAGFDVPNADLIFEPVVGRDESVHYLGHLHDPYDTVELAREVGDVLEQMARLAMAVALGSDQDLAAHRVPARPQGRVVFVASHTEATHMSPVSLTDLGMTLASEGLDVDMVPYGQAVTAADLEGADLVVALPVMDLAPGDLPAAYDEAWTEAEAAVLEAYAAGGGLLVVANSAHRLKYGSRGLDANEDWADANLVVARFGLSFEEGAVRAGEARTAGEHPLLAGLDSLELGPDNAVPLRLAEGSAAQVLAEADGSPVVVVVDHGRGQVLVLADLGLLTSATTDVPNLRFWQNLARYAAGR